MSSLPANNFRRSSAIACFLLTAIIGLAIDQWSKVEAFNHLCAGIADNGDGTSSVIGAREVVFIPGLINFSPVVNPGAVFGLGAGKQTLFKVVSFAAMIFIVYLFAQSGRQRIYQILLGMLMAGVVGNLYDRMRFNYVRDMIHGLPHWPRLFPYIFNVADTFLCTGVALMLVYSLLTDPGKPKVAAEQN